MSSFKGFAYLFNLDWNLRPMSGCPSIVADSFKVDSLSMPAEIVADSCKMESTWMPAEVLLLPMKILPYVNVHVDVSAEPVKIQIPGYNDLSNPMTDSLLARDEPWKIGGLQCMDCPRKPGTGVSERRYKRRMILSIVVRKFKKANIITPDWVNSLVLEVWDDTACDLMSKREWEAKVMRARQFLPAKQ
eukprot:s1422_g7.t1